MAPTPSYVRNHWYAAAIADEVEPGKLLARKVLGQGLVLFRDAQGRAAVLHDRCPHRNVSLSLGCVVGSHVQCGYHGLQFDRNGTCVKMPGSDQPPPAVIKAGTWPLVAKHGYVWVWPGDAQLADDALVPDYGWQEQAGWIGALAVRISECNYVLALENVLDLSHATFVHGQTVGTAAVAQTQPEVVVRGSEVDVIRRFPATEMAPIYRKITGWDIADRTQTITYFGVNCVRIDITLAPVGNTDPQAVLHMRFGGPYTPETDRSHLHFSSAWRNFALDDAELTVTLIEMIKKTYGEDVALLEDQQRHIDNGTAQPNRLFGVDKGPVVAMRILQQSVARDSAASATANATANAQAASDTLRALPPAARVPADVNAMT